MKTLDTRNLYKRKCELEELRDAVESASESLEDARKALAAFDPDRPDDEEWFESRRELEEAVENAEAELEAAEKDFTGDDEEELAELETLENEISDFMHGETLIPEDDFEDYARQFAEDIGAIDESARWPCTCIDWSQAADELRQDYIEFTYQGTIYLCRA